MTPPRQAQADRGELCIVLHSHMPYVEGFGTWPFGEEWLLEAMAASYLPLLRVLERRAERGARGRRDGRRHAGAGRPARAAGGGRAVPARSCAACARECHRQDAAGLDAGRAARGRGGPARSARRLRARRRGLRAPRRRPARGAAAAARRGRDRAVGVRRDARRAAAARDRAGRARCRSQTGIGAHRERFGAWSGGFWLPECAYRPGPRGPARRAPACAPSASTRPGRRRRRSTSSSRSPPGGAVAVPIDWSTIELVWDERGYPADPVYRDYHAPDGERDARVGERRRALRPRRGARASARARARTSWTHVIARAERLPGRARAARSGRLRARHRAARPLVVRGACVAGAR